MTTCIYYEQELVSADDARHVRALAGDCVCEVAPADTTWAEDIPGPPPGREPHSRSLQILDYLMPQTDRWGKSVEEAAPSVAQRHGLSLAEVAKYELLFALAAAGQRWQALANIHGRWNPDRILWLTSRADRELATLCRAAAPTRIEIHRRATRNKPSWKSAWQSFKNAVAPGVKGAASIARAGARSPRWPSQHPDVVCTEYFPNNVAVSLPVAERLQAQFGLHVLWLAGRRKVADALAARGVESLVLPELLSARAHFRGHFNGGQRHAVRSALRGLGDELFRGTLLPGEREYFLTVLEPRILTAWNNAAYWIEAYHEAFSALRPAAVMSTTYSSVMGRASALAAQRFGGRGIYLQHGLIPRCSAFCSFCHDLLLMWGANDLRNLVEFGVDPHTIRVTGPTIYDTLARRRSNRPASALPVAPQPLKVAFMASRTGGSLVSHTQAKSCLLAVATAVRRVTAARLTVKLHPGDHTGMIPDVMRGFPEVTVVQSGNSQDVIVQSDLVIVVLSTTGLEACAADKPLIVLDVFDEPSSVPYASYGAAVRVRAAQGDLATALEQVIAQLRHDRDLAYNLAEGRHRLMDDMLNGAAGDAADQAALAVAEALGRCEAQPIAQDSGQ